MSRVLLVSANLTTDPLPVYPLGMAVVAGGLNDRGHEVAQFDALAASLGHGPELETRIGDFRPEVIGISMRNLDTCDSLSFRDYPAHTRDLVTRIRAVTTAPILLGGPAFSILPEALLDYTGADHGIVGEGEVLAADLVEGLAAGREMPRILRSSALLTPDSIGAPLLDPDLVTFYQGASGMLNIQTRRGCPHHCLYCNYPVLEGRHYRFRDPEAVVDDLHRANREHGARRFFFADSVFNDDEGHHLRLAEAILRRGLELEWTCYMRPQGLRREHLRLLKRAGLTAAELGTDAASDATLRGLGKGFTFGDVLETNETFVDCRVPCAHFVVFGGPKETRATVQEGLANLERLRSTVVFAYTGLRIFPGTPLHRLALREGCVSPENDLRDPVYYHAPGLDPQELHATLEAAFRKRRDRFFPPERARERMEVMRRMGFRGQLWDTLIRFPDTSAGGDRPLDVSLCVPPSPPHAQSGAGPDFASDSAGGDRPLVSHGDGTFPSSTDLETTC